MKLRTFGIGLAALVGLGLVARICWAAETARPKITGIAYVRIKVTDAAKAEAFYKGTLRLPQPRSRCFGPDEECLFLKIGQQIDLMKVAGPSTGKQIDSVGLFTSDVRELRQYLVDKGWKPGELTADSSFKTSFEIQDPENHRLVFVQLTAAGIGGSIGGESPLAARLIHAGFVVKDQETMDKFYRDALGFRGYWHGGMKEGETNWVDLQVSDGTDWIEYMLGVPENADKHTLGVMNHIALGVPDIKVAAEQLKKNGAKLTEEPKIGRDGKWQLNLYDPDGTRVEMMEFTPVQKPCCSGYTGKHPGP